MRKTSGNVEIIFLMFIFSILIIVSFILYTIYVQINTYIIPIKQDLFYIVQNSYFSLSQSNLEYNDYAVDNNKLKDRVSKILKLNYPNVTLNNINYNYSENKVYVEVIVNVNPVVLSNYIGNIKIKMKDVVKLKMLEVKL